MSIHDWSKVPAGIFHNFHAFWNIELCKALNGGLLPPGYYALVEQVARPVVPDVLTLQFNGTGKAGNVPAPGKRVALLDKPPKVQTVQEESDVDAFAKKANRVAIRHVSDDAVVAIIEVLSPGNKSSQHAIDDFLKKVWDLLDLGIHLLLIDLFAPTPRDPDGLHARIWGADAVTPPADQPLTLAAYQASSFRRAYVEPTAIGRTLIDMPLFLDDDHYVPVPLETTYQAAWRELPQRWKDVLE